MTARRRNALCAICFGAAILIGTTAFIMKWLRQPVSQIRYGVKEIVSAGGQRVYLKRAVGLSYDRRSLSLNGERCNGPDESADYLLSDMDSGGEYPFYYKAGLGELTAYTYLTPPKQRHWPIVVRQQTMDPGQYATLSKAPDEGFLKINLPLNELNSCP